MQKAFHTQFASARCDNVQMLLNSGQWICCTPRCRCLTSTVAGAIPQQSSYAKSNRIPGSSVQPYMVLLLRLQQLCNAGAMLGSWVLLTAVCYSVRVQATLLQLSPILLLLPQQLLGAQLKGP